MPREATTNRRDVSPAEWQRKTICSRTMKRAQKRHAIPLFAQSVERIARFPLYPVAISPFIAPIASERSKRTKNNKQVYNCRYARLSFD